MITAPIPDGIHFGLDDEAYHADTALGSTNLRQLLASGPDYWWSSSLNRSRPKEEPNNARLFGKALHKLVLEGRQAFDARYEREPVGDDVLVTDRDLAEWLTQNGIEKHPRSKAEKVQLVATLDPSVRIADLICQRAADEGRDLIKTDDFDRMLISGAMITGNPELSTAFEGGVPEVSVFWTDENGVRLKCRFDYLKVRGIGDLKSIRNSKGLPFAEACRQAIAGHRYDIQAAHYLAGRAALPRLVEAGAVFGDHDPAWLRRVAEADAFGFAWVFFQAADAPITWATSISPGNPILDVARISIRNAIETYRTFMDRFGPDEMWVLAEPMNELDVSELPGWWARAA